MLDQARKVETKIMFINAIDAADKIATSLPPLGLSYLASSLRQKFGPDRFKFKIIDRAVEEQTKEFKPDLVGISSVSQNYNRAIEYAKIAKGYNLPVVMGGVHISALPSTLTNDMDVGVIGEGEETIIELVELFLRKGFWDKEELAKVNGIVFRKGEDIILTEERRPIEPLDTISPPARDLLSIKESTYMFTSRGCPYRCTFCASCRFWGKVRFFSAEYVVNEIKDLVNTYETNQIALADDLFVANKARVKRILELLKKENLLDKVKFVCNVRSDTVTDELVTLLKGMNATIIGMGLESGSPETLAYLKGNNISVNDHINAITTFRRQGIEPHASFIIGSPQESREDILQTLSFIKENRLMKFDLYVLTPFPGTPVWEYAKARNLVSEDMDWDILNVNFKSNCDRAIILSEKLTGDQIYRLYSLFIKYKKKMRNKAKMKRIRERLKLLLRGVLATLVGKPRPKKQKGEVAVGKS